MQPTYPDIARSRRLSGTVILAAHISPGGKITNLFPIASPDPSLSDAAIAAVKTWIYQPYLLNGTPVDVHTVITVNFNIGG